MLGKCSISKGTSCSFASMSSNSQRLIDSCVCVCVCADSSKSNGQLKSIVTSGAPLVPSHPLHMLIYVFQPRLDPVAALFSLYRIYCSIFCLRHFRFAMHSPQSGNLVFCLPHCHAIDIILSKAPSTTKFEALLPSFRHLLLLYRSSKHSAVTSRI